MAKAKIKLLDTVALLEDLPKHGLRRGEVGTVVHLFRDGAFEVEFSDEDGQAYAELSLEPSQVIALHKQGKSLRIPSAA
jgi:hypothetical protein